MGCVKKIKSKSKSKAKNKETDDVVVSLLHQPYHLKNVDILPLICLLCVFDTL